MSRKKAATKEQHNAIRELAIEAGAEELTRVIKRFGITSSVALTFNQATQTIRLLAKSPGVKPSASDNIAPPVLVSEQPAPGSITDKQKSYLKSLIRKTGGDAYHEIILNEGMVAGTKVNQLSLKQASRMIDHLIARLETGQKPDKSPTGSYQISNSSLIEAGSVATLNAEFTIETYYNTTMLVDTGEKLLTWAEKRFRDDSPSLKRIEAFLKDNQQPFISVQNYKIKRNSI